MEERDTMIKDCNENILQRDKIIVEGTQRIKDLTNSLKEVAKRVANKKMSLEENMSYGIKLQ
jgi:hypothetical protein